MAVSVTYKFSDFCLCPQCLGDLSEAGNALQCRVCTHAYEIRNGIPILLPQYGDGKRQRYLENYEKIAKDDLQQPLESNREARHASFLSFVGALKGRRVLDIGSSHALYLRKTEPAFKVAFDIAFPYLEAIPDSDGLLRICGDAECLPFKAGVFDVIIISDILEHVLSPEKLVARLKLICDRSTRIYVHVPWEESLEPYNGSRYEFSHLRSFEAYTYSELWRGFCIKRSKCSYPNMKYPLLFGLEGKVPRFLYNTLVYYYFHSSSMVKKDFAWRLRRISGLPKWEQSLLRFFKPTFKMFEMRLYNRHWLRINSLLVRVLDRVFG